VLIHDFDKTFLKKPARREDELTYSERKQENLVFISTLAHLEVVPNYIELIESRKVKRCHEKIV